MLVASDFSDKKFSDAQGWSFIGAKGKNSATQCADVSLAGGFDIFGKGALASKKFVLNPHTSLRMRL